MRGSATAICVMSMVLGLHPQAWSAGTDIVIENAEMTLVIGEDGRARSLVHKDSGQECLAELPDRRANVFSLVQDRPYENELQLAYPARQKSFAAESVRRSGDKLIVDFELVGYEAIIDIAVTDAYIGFTLETLKYSADSFRNNKETPVDELILLQLPVASRANFGEWLNVMWDDDVAVNLLATNPYTRIDSEDLSEYRLLRAAAVSDVRLEGTGAALITTNTESLLDRIARVEEDYDLPRGVESRRSPEYKNSYYEARQVTPRTIHRHITYARQAGFRAMLIYYPDFAKSAGHFPWRRDYVKGIDDLRFVVKKIEDAGMTPGLHIHYNKAQRNDPYVTPVPDDRLNLSRIFTLAQSLDPEATVVQVHENPRGCTRDDERRYLKIGHELVSYDDYTTFAPYQFTGCKRGQLGTTPSAHEAGYLFGLLDMDTSPKFMRFNQNTTIQAEVAERLGSIYRDAGFRFLYFDGAEDVPPPYWFNVSRSQLAVYRECTPPPVLAEGSCKSHFSWHMVTRGNAFDTFKPEVIKQAVRRHPGEEAPRLAMDFTAVNFGWIGYEPPGDDRIGMQPDMIEYVTSRAAAWNSPISLIGYLKQLDSHSRTPDNLEVIRRWEDARADGYLTDEQRQELQNPDQEHTLLLNEAGELELVPYERIDDVAGGSSDVRAFLFERSGSVWTVYWHTSGEALLEVPVEVDQVRLMKELGKPLTVEAETAQVVLPVGERRYLEWTLPRDRVVAAMQKATITAGR